MGRRNAFGPLVGAIARAARAADRDRQRQIRHRIAVARYEQREQERAERNYWQQTRLELSQMERERKAEERELARKKKEEERAYAQAEKDRKRAYLEERQQEAVLLNENVRATLSEFNEILPKALNQNHMFDFDVLKNFSPYENFNCPKNLEPGTAPVLIPLAPISFFKRLIPGSGRRQKRRLEYEEEKYRLALEAYATQEEEKRVLLRALEDNYLERKAAYDAEVVLHNEGIDDLKVKFLERDPQAIVKYFEYSLKEACKGGLLEEQSLNFRLAYSNETGELVVEQGLPTVEVVPTAVEYRYVKSRDEIDAKPMKPIQTKEVYSDLVAGLSLRTLHVLYLADDRNLLNLVTFTGILDTHSRRTGKRKKIPIVSVRVTREEFFDLNLHRVDKILCLKKLGAQVSSHPEEMLAIKPIVQFDMVDKRFIEQSDLLSSIQNTPNLMDLSPADFEVLVANLFGEMGLETKLTQSSRDGGVDAIAYDERPILGGKVIIQAKRYSNTVGVSAVRDLYGTMLNEGANKGILVTTSKYGPDAYHFSKDKPIELIDGPGLLYLLQEHAKLEARIVFSI